MVVDLIVYVCRQNDVLHALDLNTTVPRENPTSRVRPKRKGKQHQQHQQCHPQGMDSYALHFVVNIVFALTPDIHLSRNLFIILVHQFESREIPAKVSKNTTVALLASIINKGRPVFNVGVGV